jgi:hypothetical protein
MNHTEPEECTDIPVLALFAALKTNRMGDLCQRQVAEQPAAHGATSPASGAAPSCTA